MEEKVNPPKVFISYCHTSGEHKQSVKDLADRLMNDGVDVTIDLYDAKYGNSVTKFMEEIAKDEMSKVLIIVDKEYGKKAEDRAGGVGYETEIVTSQLILASGAQTKYIPIVWEKNEEGKDYLPSYLKSLLHIDFVTNHVSSYDELLRDIHNLPRYIKPPVGSIPAHLQSDKLEAVPQAIKDELSSSLRPSPNLSSSLKLKRIFDEYSAQLITSKVPLDINQNSNEHIDRIDALIDSTNAFTELMNYKMLEIGEEILPPLKKFLETCLLNYQPQVRLHESFHEYQTTPLKFLTQEFIIRFLSLSLNNELFDVAKKFLEMKVYISSRHQTGYNSIQDFYDPMNMIDQNHKQKVRSNFITLSGDMYLKRIDTDDLISRNQFIGSDVVLFVNGLFGSNSRWYPRTVYYLNYNEIIEYFDRASWSPYFNKFKDILLIKDVKELQQKINEHKRWFEFSAGGRPIYLQEHLGLSKLNGF